MGGAGTSVEVAREMSIEAYGLNFHSGFNILKTSILEDSGQDHVLSLPPYHDMIPIQWLGVGEGRGTPPRRSLAVRERGGVLGKAARGDSQPTQGNSGRGVLRHHHWGCETAGAVLFLLGRGYCPNA
jgi:hypothetical protein